MRRNCLSFVITAMATVAAAATVAAPPAARADALLIERIEAAQTATTDRPARGMTMDKVAARWGAPVKKSDAVGQPPISRWDYAEFIVFFEYDHVLHISAPRS